MDFDSSGIGTKVTVTTATRVQYAEVGMFENSRYSQGHYRLYFGLKEETIIDTIEIQYMNGTIDVLDDVTVNQILFY